MPSASSQRTRRYAGRALAALIAVAAAMLGLSAGAQATVSFATAPALPTLPAITLNGHAQTTTTAMTNFAISSSNPNSGWNVTVAGLSGGANSPVFKQYCPNATCGTDIGPGYIAAGYTLPADSLTLNTTGATWTTGGTKPTFRCNAGCHVDNATATKIVSASTSVATGTWTTTGFSATSLSLTTPTTLKKLRTNEVYRVNVVWTLNSGP
ncbi:MAG: hypothetical protein ACRDQH_11030 [Pseudonocardiaceae bacterium]